MKVPFTGGCRCGSVRFECSAEPLRVVHCYCTDCQKLTGTQMSTNVMLPKNAFKVTQGTPAVYQTTGDSGQNVNRFFCASCGTPLWGEPEVLSEMVIIKAGSLDDTRSLEPAASIYVDSAPGWAIIPDSIPRFGKMPPA